MQKGTTHTSAKEAWREKLRELLDKKDNCLAELNTASDAATHEVLRARLISVELHLKYHDKIGKRRGFTTDAPLRKKRNRKSKLTVRSQDDVTFDEEWKREIYALTREIKSLQGPLTSKKNKERISVLKLARAKLLREHGVSPSVVGKGQAFKGKKNKLWVHV